MSIGIYAFLRIYFLGFGVSVFAQFRTHGAGSPAHAPPRSARRACLVSSADRCSVSSVRARVPCLAWSALVLARPALLPVLCSPSGCAGAGVSTGGVYSRRPAPPGQSRHHRKNKKGSKITPPPLPILKISRKNKKTPTKGLRSVLYLLYKP